MLRRAHGGPVHSFAVVDFRQNPVVVIRRSSARFGIPVGRIVPTLPVELQKTVEPYCRSRGTQPDHPVRARNVGRYLVEDRALHLGGDGAFPDQLVEFYLFGSEVPCHIARPSEQVCRADCLMGFLGVLRLRPVAPRALRHIGTAVVMLDQAAATADRFA